MRDPDETGVFRCSGHIAKPPSGCETCFLFWHALGCEVFRHRFDVKFHLFAQQALPLAVIEPIPQTPSITLPVESGFHGIPSGEAHDAGYCPRNLAVASGLLGQVFTAVGSELI